MQHQSRGPMLVTTLAVTHGLFFDPEAICAALSQRQDV